ncbi:MAG TPA: ATPase domain-containing protein, partial [Methylomirabilota bacterium]|nr:ATPase domain-containing protein [Methylomirabilota bacterium]
MRIPGISHLVEGGTLPNSVLLLTGPVGAGKTMYCRQFFIDGLNNDAHCIYISSTLSENQYKSLFAGRVDLLEHSKFVNPYLTEGQGNEKLCLAFEKINHIIANITTNRKTTTKSMNNSDAVSTNFDDNRAILLIIDSLTHLFAIF